MSNQNQPDQQKQPQKQQSQENPKDRNQSPGQQPGQSGQNADKGQGHQGQPVSYTHLTLPTSDLV